MSTPTDPYNSQSRRPFDDDEILEPLSEEFDGPINNDPQNWEETEAQYAEDTDVEPRYEDVEPSYEADATELAPETFESEPAETNFAEPAEANVAAPAEADFAEPAEDNLAASAEREDVPVALDAEGDQADDLPAAPINAPAVETPDYVDEDDVVEAPNPTLGAYFANADNNDEMVIDYASAQEETKSPNRTSVIPASNVSDPDAVGDTAAIDNTAAAVAAPAAFVAPAATQTWTNDPGEITEIPEAPKKRIGAHFGSFFATLLLVPVAWYLLSDAGARLFLVEDNPWATQQTDIFPVLELVGGLVVAAIIWILARTSSLGAQIWGAILAIAGLGAIILPQYGVELISQLDNAIGDYNPFTGNVVHHLNQDLGSGRIAIFGALLLLTGLVAHQARKRGQERGNTITRREFLLKNEEN